MAVYHVGQSYPDLVVETGLDISTGTDFFILYTKPSGKKGKWVGTLEGTTQVRYSFKLQDLDESGTWVVQSHIAIGNQMAYGMVVDLVVNEPIQVQVNI